jgi:AraC family transcriptional regulator
MEYESMIQSVLDKIDEHITERIQDEDFARGLSYSKYHFRRVFMELTGTPFTNYVTRRKLEYAMCDVSRGKRIIEAAMNYGFQTHAGFSKAFKKHFGCSPTVYLLHVPIVLPEKATLLSVKLKYGGIEMSPHIIEFTPFITAGRTNRQRLPNVKHTSDIPAYWDEPQSEGYKLLGETNKLFPKSKHCEIVMCYDADESTGEFTYFVGRGITHQDDMKNIQPDMVTYEISGLYAVFQTPPVSEKFAQTIRETWNGVLTQWLPGSEFEYDETRKDFEYHDYRAHGWFFGGKDQIDLCIPIRLKAEAAQRAREMDVEFWEEEKALRS